MLEQIITHGAALLNGEDGRLAEKGKQALHTAGDKGKEALHSAQEYAGDKGKEAIHSVQESTHVPLPFTEVHGASSRKEAKTRFKQAREKNQSGKPTKVLNPMRASALRGSADINVSINVGAKTGAENENN